ncbi:MAG: GIY-YIG nuclease family protein [Candidatus Woesebacteria bacterium]|jgi:hypothetical protein
MNSPRLISTYLLDGSIEGVRIIELSESSIKAFVIPRIKLNDVKTRDEINWPALYLLINSGDNQLYIGESEKFYDRVKNHDQSKDFWDVVVAIVSSNNSLEKSDVKYLESLAVKKAKTTAAMEVLNKTVPVRNNIHEFKIHSLEKTLEDVALIAESLGYSIFRSENITAASTWYVKAKKTDAKAEFRGDKFVIIAGSKIDKSVALSFKKGWPKRYLEREEILTKAKDHGDHVVLLENIPFKSPNLASDFATGRSTNTWITWKNKDGKTMDEVIRKGES